MDPCVHLRRLARPCGLSLVELVVGLALVLTLASLATIAARTLEVRASGLGAARYLAARLAEARLDALQGGVSCGWQFLAGPTGVTFRPVRDGNGNGLRLDDLARGVDVVVRPPERIDDHFPHARLALVTTVLDEDGTVLAEGTAPVRVGPSGLVSFGPAGTATSGTIYLGTRDGRQFAVRLFGATGRLRVLEYQPGDRTWTPR